MSAVTALVVMLMCHAVSAVLSVIWLVSAGRREAKQRQQIVRLRNELRAFEDRQAQLQTQLAQAQRNDGRDPKTGRYIGAKK